MADLDAREVRRVAIIGTGVIGAGWAARCLARGIEVVASDPAPGAEGRLRESVANAWPAVLREEPGPISGLGDIGESRSDLGHAALEKAPLLHRFKCCAPDGRRGRQNPRETSRQNREKGSKSHRASSSLPRDLALVVGQPVRKAARRIARLVLRCSMILTAAAVRT